MKEPYRTLISAAVLAPSGDNTQPWRFEINEAETSITVYVHETRDRSPMNAGQRMARIACGAAIENMVRTAEFNGWEYRVEWHESPIRLATLCVAGEFSVPGSIEKAITERHTNRRLYDGRNMPAAILQELTESALPADGTSVVWITDRNALKSYADLIGQADSLMFGEPRFLRAFLENVRFDRPVLEAVSEGLSIGSLEVSPFERRMLPVLRYMPGWALHSWPLQRGFQQKASKLVTSASGLCLIHVSSRTPSVDVSLGRTFQRVWLRLTELGISAQPMMSFPVVHSSAEQARAGSRFESDVKQLAAKFAARDKEQRLPAAAIRFGYGDGPTSNNGRMPCAAAEVVKRELFPEPALL